MSLGVKMSLDHIPTSECNTEELVQYRQLLGETSTACDAAVIILNDLLLLDKLESGALTLVKQTFRVGDLAEAATNMLAIQLRARQLFISYDSISDDTDDPNSKQLITRRMSWVSSLRDEMIEGDKNKLTQVLYNLLSNAIKFTSTNGKIEFKATFEPSSSQIETEKMQLFGDDIGNFIEYVSGNLILQVIDDGVGISAQDQQRLFKGIVQFKPELLQSGGGSGLGLHISKRILELHGGSIYVTSDGEGKGTAFSVELQMQRHRKTSPTSILTTCTDDGTTGQIGIDDHMLEISTEIVSEVQLSSSHCVDDTAAKIVSELSNSKVVTDYNNRPFEVQSPSKDLERAKSARIPRLLIVDDSEPTRKMMGRLLVGEGYECDFAENGIKAVTIIETSIRGVYLDGAGLDSFAREYDAILMDYVMPEMDGPAATRAIRELGYKGPIIGVTGNALPSDMESFLQAGVTRVLVKPVTKGKLLDILTGERISIYYELHFINS